MIADNLVGKINQVKKLLREIENKNVHNPSILGIWHSLSKEDAFIAQAFRFRHKTMEFKEWP